MARNDWYIGDPTAIGITTNAITTTSSWGGTAKTLRYFRPMQDAAGLVIGREQNPLGSLDVDPPVLSTGGQRIAGSFTLPLSYAYHEGIFSMIAGGDDTTTGTGPYLHTIALLPRLRYGTLVYYWENYAGTRFQLLMNNVAFTQVTITQAAQERPTIAVNWVAEKFTKSTPGSAPTLSTLEYPDWDDCVLTIGAAALVNKSFSLDISQPVEEGDYGMAHAGNPNVVFIGRAGQRSTVLTVESGLDDIVDGWLQAAGTALTTNNITWNNGEIAAANRRVVCTLGDLLISPADTQRGNFGKMNTNLTFTSYGATPFAFTTTNGIAVSEPPTV